MSPREGPVWASAEPNVLLSSSATGTWEWDKARSSAHLKPGEWTKTELKLIIGLLMKNGLLRKLKMKSQRPCVTYFREQIVLKGLKKKKGVILCKWMLLIMGWWHLQDRPPSLPQARRWLEMLDLWGAGQVIHLLKSSKIQCLHNSLIPKNFFSIALNWS